MFFSIFVFNFLETGENKSPNLIPYPSWGSHRSLNSDEAPEIVSPFRIRADRCGRLWVLDTGVEDILNVSETKQLAPSQVLVYDLRNDNLIRRYEIPKDQTVEGKSFFANIAVEDDDCDNTFAYLADLGGPGLVVYSWRNQESWRVTHHYFHPDPLQGSYNVSGVQFQWPDGLFGIAVSGRQDDGNATLYFHPLSSTNEFSVSTSVLHNQTLATSPQAFREFQIVGSRGTNGQSGASFLDKSSGVIFYTLPNLNEIACWRTNSKDRYNIDNGNVYVNPTELVFPNDIKVDDKNRIWTLSDNLQQFIYGELNRSDVNYRVLSGDVDHAIKKTACELKTTFKDIIPNIVNKVGEKVKTLTKDSGNSAALPMLSYITVAVCIVAPLLFIHGKSF